MATSSLFQHFYLYDPLIVHKCLHQSLILQFVNIHLFTYCTCSYIFLTPTFSSFDTICDPYKQVYLFIL